MSQEHPHVAEKPDILSCDAQWWKEFAEVMKPMVFHLQDLQAVFRDGEGDDEHFKTIYDGTLRLRQDMVELKEQQQKVLDTLLETKDDWTTALSARSGELGRLDTEVHRRAREIETQETVLEDAEKRQRDAQEELAAVEKLTEHACKDLEMARTNKATLQETYRQEVDRSLARERENIGKKIEDWKADVDKTSAQQQEREDNLVAKERQLEKLSQDLVEEKEKSEGVQSQNESQAHDLRSAYSTLQSLANLTDSSSTLPPDLSHAQGLAVSIENRFKGLRSDLTETRRNLISEQEQSSHLSIQLEAKTKEIEVLSRSHQKLEQSLLTSQKLAFDLTEKSEELQRLQPIFEDQRADLTQLQTDLATKEDEIGRTSAIADVQSNEIKGFKQAIEVYKKEKRLQLGHWDRSTLLAEFSASKGASSECRMFTGECEGEPVEVCLDILRNREEAIVVTRDRGNSCVVWHGDMNDCTFFRYAWRFWIRFGKIAQRKAFYISLSLNEEVVKWLQSSLAQKAFVKAEEGALSRTIGA